jgi:hypothetical protein
MSLGSTVARERLPAVIESSGDVLALVQEKEVSLGKIRTN